MTFSPRVPLLEFVEIIHLVKHRRLGRCDVRRPCGAELRGLQRHDDEEHNDDYCNCDQDFFEHRISLVIFVRTALQTYPPAIAPTIRNGSFPLTTSSGNLVSGGSSERSSLHVKNC